MFHHGAVLHCSFPRKNNNLQFTLSRRRSMEKKTFKNYSKELQSQHLNEERQETSCLICGNFVLKLHPLY